MRRRDPAPARTTATVPREVVVLRSTLYAGLTLAAVEDMLPLLTHWPAEREDELRLPRQFQVQVRRALTGTDS